MLVEMFAKIEKCSAEVAKLKILYLNMSSKMKPSMNSYECHFLGLRSNLCGVLNYMQTHYTEYLHLYKVLPFLKHKYWFYPS